MPSSNDGRICLYQNVRGLNLKIDGFYSYVSDSECDVIGITETWLQPSVNDSELFSGDYQVFIEDHNLQLTGLATGGGVLLAFKNTIICTKIDTTLFDQSFVNIDLLICKCQIANQSFIVLLVYTPPSVSIDVLESFFECLETVDMLHNHNLLCMGDFNISEYINNNFNNRNYNAINQFITFYDLQQMNNIRNSSGHLLDLVLSDMECDVIRNVPPIVPEDRHHSSLFLHIYNLPRSPVYFNQIHIEKLITLNELIIHICIIR